MSGKSHRKSSKKQRQIVETAETLFTRHGIKRITVEEICQKAGVSKMTFYKYFANKIELVKHLWNNWIEESFDKLDEIDAMDIAFPEKIELMFAWKAELVSKMSTEFIEELLPIEFEKEKAMRRFLEFIMKAQERGDIRPEIRPEFIMAIISWKYNRSPFSFRKNPMEKELYSIYNKLSACISGILLQMCL